MAWILQIFFINSRQEGLTTIKNNFKNGKNNFIWSLTMINIYPAHTDATHLVAVVCTAHC